MGAFCCLQNVKHLGLIQIENFLVLKKQQGKRYIKNILLLKKQESKRYIRNILLLKKQQGKIYNITKTTKKYLIHLMLETEFCQSIQTKTFTFNHLFLKCLT